MWPVVCSGAIKRHYKVDALILLDAYKLSYWLITTLTSYFILHSESDCDCAIVIHSILEIVRGISDEGENVEIIGILTHNSVCCIHPSLEFVDLSRQLFLRQPGAIMTTAECRELGSCPLLK